MNRGIHPALAFAKQVEGWSPGVFGQVDKWRETDSLAPWRFMTSRQCKRWLEDWLKRNPAPEEGFLCPVMMKRFPPHIVYMTLAAWRTGKTLLHYDESLFRVLGETRQTDALPGDMLRHLPFLGFWLDFPADMFFAEGQGALMGAFFPLADHDNQADALLALTLTQDPISREPSHQRLRPHVRKAHWQSHWKGRPTQGEENSMLLKWKPPQIVNSKDDDSLEAVVRFMKETNKREKK